MESFLRSGLASRDAVGARLPASIAWDAEPELRLQVVHGAASRAGLGDLDGLAAHHGRIGVTAWVLFFLVVRLVAQVDFVVFLLLDLFLFLDRRGNGDLAAGGLGWGSRDALNRGPDSGSVLRHWLLGTLDEVRPFPLRGQLGGAG